MVALAPATVLLLSTTTDSETMVRPTVLVVDDEKSIRVFAEKALAAAGYEPQAVSNGPDALRLMENHSFALFVIDLAMPQMSGTELAQQIRCVNPSAKILYFTGFADHLFEEKRRLWQDEAFLEKPVQMAGFLEAVSLLLFGHIRGPQAPAA
jgi:two-component system cell cycle sensor histidine kinase/response regulator CckA